MWFKALDWQHLAMTSNAKQVLIMVFSMVSARRHVKKRLKNNWIDVPFTIEWE